MTRTALLVAAVMSAVLLPPVTFASGTLAYLTLADTITMPIPYAGAVEQLAGQSIAYWFLALAAFSIASWTWIVKWLIRQLAEQRAANSLVSSQLLEYLAKDHSNTIAVLDRTNELLDRALAELARTSRN